MNWNKHLALLTGATGGIGQSLAFALAAKGVSLILQGRNETALQSLAEQLPGEHNYICADLLSQEGLDSVLTKISEYEQLSMLINNAGINDFGFCEQQSSDKIHQLLHLNLHVPVLLSQSLLPVLKRQPVAHVVNIGSVFGSIGFAGHSLYCASKFGLRGFTEALQREFSDSHVNVHYLAPRATETSMNSQTMREMNRQLGSSVDSPNVVAKELISMIEQQRSRKTIGFPESLFVRINGAFPGIVDNSLQKKLGIIKRFATSQTEVKL